MELFAQTKQENVEITGNVEGRVKAGVMPVLGVLSTGLVNKS